jgi:2-C-methyl-D-erythritol 4-phosphate cytidylyltransferase
MDQLLTPDSVRAAVVVLAGGSGTRLGAAVNKVYLPLAGRHVISWSILHAWEAPSVRRVVLVTRPQDDDLVRTLCARECPTVPVDLVTGGGSRHDSEQSALDLLAPAIDAGELDVIAIHDGARPLAGTELFTTVIRTAERFGAAVPGVPVHGVIPARDTATAPAARLPGSGLVAVQTPQAFRAGDLLAAYRAARREGFRGTDTAATIERYSGLEIRHVPSDRRNLKVTFPHDLDEAARLLAALAR